MPKSKESKAAERQEQETVGSRGYGREISLSGPNPLMWTVQMVAKALEVSDDYVYGLVQRREIPFIRFGTNIRFHYADVRAYVNDLRAASLAEADHGAASRRG